VIKLCAKFELNSAGARKIVLGADTAPPSPIPPLPLSPLPFPTFLSPSLPLSSLPLPLEVGPLKFSYGVWGSDKRFGAF